MKRFSVSRKGGARRVSSQSSRVKGANVMMPMRGGIRL